MEGQEDLCIVTNDTYYGTFDWYTPRPHMIILGNRSSKNHFMKCQRPSGMEMNANEKRSMLEIAKKIYDPSPKPLPDLPNIDSPAILSIHFGSWFGIASKVFHAHVCIPISGYESWMSKYKGNLILQKKLQSTENSYDSYMQKAKKPPKDYTKDDMAAVKSALSKQPDMSDDWSKYACHRNHMRIGFISHGDKLMLLGEMEAFILKHGLHLSKRGGHICIDLSSKGFSGYRKLNDNAEVQRSQVQGYLQLPGDVFGMILGASNHAQTWMGNDHTSIGVICT